MGGEGAGEVRLERLIESSFIRAVSFGSPRRGENLSDVHIPSSSGSNWLLSGDISITKKIMLF
jgi:hypothetical protein